MTLKKSQIAATAAVAGFLVWIITAKMDAAQTKAPPPQHNTAEIRGSDATLPSVEVKPVRAQAYDRQLRLQGQIEPWHSVALRARVAGTVNRVLATQGQALAAGDPLIQLEPSELQARLRSAEAAVRLKEAELNAAEKLYKTNLQTETAVLRLKSELENARSAQVQARRQLEYAAPRAPFDGILNRLDAEPGQYMSAGEIWGQIVNIRQLKALAQVPQQQIADVALGQQAEVILLDGRRLTGQISFIASAAETETRSFSVEVTLDNPQQLRIAGASATVNLHLGTVAAHKLSPALLSLNDRGELGVKWVNSDNQVVFQTVELLSTGTDGAWVSRLPDPVPVITLGGGFVRHGQQVRVSEAAPETEAVQPVTGGEG